MAPRDQLERDDRGSKRKAGSTSEILSIQSTSFCAIAEDEEDAVPPLEEEVRDELYGQLNTQVVGTRLYRGLVGSGQEVLLVRGSGIDRSVHTIQCSFIIPNLRDSSTVQVKNCSRVLVGNVPRGVASKLAPLMDQKRISVEGVMNDGNSSSHIPVLILLDSNLCFYSVSGSAPLYQLSMSVLRKPFHVHSRKLNPPPVPLNSTDTQTTEPQ